MISQSIQQSISKYMCYLLRHHPEVAHLTPDEGGWVQYIQLLTHLYHKYPGLTFDDVQTIISTDSKQRYACTYVSGNVSCNNMIRCNQGHSYPVDLGLMSIEPPKYLYHGTSDRSIVCPQSENGYVRTIESIEKCGLHRGHRHHVHLSEDIDTAKSVGYRCCGPLVVYRVYAGQMYALGMMFFQSENGVWLTNHVPPQYLERYKE